MVMFVAFGLGILLVILDCSSPDGVFCEGRESVRNDRLSFCWQLTVLFERRAARTRISRKHPVLVGHHCPGLGCQKVGVAVPGQYSGSEMGPERLVVRWRICLSHAMVALVSKRNLMLLLHAIVIFECILVIFLHQRKEGSAWEILPLGYLLLGRILFIQDRQLELAWFWSRHIFGRKIVRRCMHCLRRLSKDSFRLARVFCLDAGITRLLIS